MRARPTRGRPVDGQIGHFARDSVSEEKGEHYRDGGDQKDDADTS